MHGAALNIEPMSGALKAQAQAEGWRTYSPEGNEIDLRGFLVPAKYFSPVVTGAMGGGFVAFPTPGTRWFASYTGEVRLIGPEFTYSVTTSVTFNYAVHPQTWTLLTPLFGLAPNPIPQQQIAR
jgi:hypothetical protein